MAANSYRSHGFECPPNAYQILTIISLSLSTIFCSITQLPHLNYSNSIIYGLCFYLSLAILSYYWVRTSLSDPTDPVVLANRAALLGLQQFDSSRYESMCTICSTSVGNNSKHCGACNRCVERFDHHCIWLNNCIGAKNYGLFFKLITIVFLHEIIVLTVSILFVFNYFNEDLNPSIGVSFIGIQFYLLFQSFIIDMFLFNLIILHIWLWKHELTTYELIKMRNKRKKQKVHVLSHTEVANSKLTGAQSPKHFYDN